MQTFTLAEGATHDLCHPEFISGSSHSKTLGNTQNEKVVARSMGQMPKQVRHDKKKKAAFTLAEVLITLGIIGVVAALTLPTLISNYQKRVYVTQLKKSASVLSNGFKLMMGHDGVTRLSDTEAFSGIDGSCNSEHDILSDRCHSIKIGLESVFSGIQFVQCDGTRLKGLDGSSRSGTKTSSYKCLEFPDGSEIFYYSFPKQAWGINYTEHQSGGLAAYVYIDVNGSKNPNTWGRDIFQLYILNNGTISPKGSQIVSELTQTDGGHGAYWRNISSDRTCGGTGFLADRDCAARVLEEDAMNY